MVSVPEETKLISYSARKYLQEKFDASYDMVLTGLSILS